jgi:hypothetical protein
VETLLDAEFDVVKKLVAYPGFQGQRETTTKEAYYMVAASEQGKEEIVEALSQLEILDRPKEAGDMFHAEGAMFHLKINETEMADCAIAALEMLKAGEWETDPQKERDMVQKTRAMLDPQFNCGTVVPKLNDSVDGMLPTIRFKYSWLEIIRGMPLSCHTQNQKDDNNMEEEDNMALLPENTPKPTKRVESSHANWRRYIFRVLVIAYSESCDTHAMNLWGERQIRAATNSKLLSQELVDIMTEHDIENTAISHINYVYGR